MLSYQCRDCRQTHGLHEGVWRCACGGVFDLAGAPSFASYDSVESRKWSLWRYRHALPLVGSGDHGVDVTLGEGCTPVVRAGEGVLVKLDFAMPTLSFKDRGSSLLVSAAKGLDVEHLVADSSGNAGTSIAAYAARAGIHAEVFVPSSTSPGKVAQLDAYGADVRLVEGNRAETAQAAIARVTESGAFYASHVYNPFFHHGVKTLAFECFEQLGGTLPDAILLPAGNGTLLIGAGIGFAELAAASLLHRVPRLYAVQAERCAPLAAARGVAVADSGKTAAEGIAIAEPPRLAQMLEVVDASGGDVLTVSEAEIERALSDLLRLGIYVEPTAAVAYAAIEKLGEARPDSILVPLTGAGLKSSGTRGQPSWQRLSGS